MDRLTDLIGQYGLDAELFPPVLIAAAVQGLGFAVVTDQAAGHDTQPEVAAAAMDRLITVLEARRSARSDP